MCIIIKVGKVIGKKGIIIQHITTETKTKLITVPLVTEQTLKSNKSPYSEEIVELMAKLDLASPQELWQPAVLSGSALNVLRAFQLINELVGTGKLYDVCVCQLCILSLTCLICKYVWCICR